MHIYEDLNIEKLLELTGELDFNKKNCYTKNWRGGFVCFTCHCTFNVPEISIKKYNYDLLNSFDACPYLDNEFKCSRCSRDSYFVSDLYEHKNEDQLNTKSVLNSLFQKRIFEVENDLKIIERKDIDYLYDISEPNGEILVDNVLGDCFEMNVSVNLPLIDNNYLTENFQEKLEEDLLQERIIEKNTLNNENKYNKIIYLMSKGLSFEGAVYVELCQTKIPIIIFDNNDFNKKYKIFNYAFQINNIKKLLLNEYPNIKENSQFEIKNLEFNKKDNCIYGEIK
jgi:hypothetical protein